ncbi:RHS repeat-associated core domain-containing protein [Paraglaciecola sp.]|uniref:RHS repeat-associated core domain-containing protein n=1 Tax=Paraglaciecola sp. TaxID=1920173 RepID=UPI002740272D|nr:RHS repeat-associated core domain-containing protein [Paraglaciecola sp.]MDP5032367.1 RHS repeat-associated core domain-containing protein [Paraglaciecola sp.]
MNTKLTVSVLIFGFLSFSTQAYSQKEREELSALFMNAMESHSGLRLLEAEQANSSRVMSTGSHDKLKLMTELALSRMEVKEHITPETTALFGDKVDLNTGSITFQHTDIALKGNNALPVEIRRSYRGSKNNRGNNASFGDWSLEIPSITTTTLEYRPGQLSHFPGCGRLEPEWVDTEFATVGAMQYWSGDTLDIPGVTNQKLRMAYDAGGGIQNARYADNWKINCLTNRYGFEATSPEGVIYTFDVVRLVPSTLVQVEQEADVLNPNYDAAVLLRSYTLNIQVSKIRDRFNNEVNFEYQSATLPYGSASQFLTYSNKLTKISATDGREINIVYEAGQNTDRVSKITSHGREWHYAYNTVYDNRDLLYKDVLKSVTRPDNKKWEFNLTFDLYGGISASQPTLADCAVISPQDNVSTLTHPEGAVFVLTHRAAQFGRTNVPYSPPGGSASPWYGEHNVGRCLTNPAIAKKELQFNNNSLVWNYQYSQNAGSPRQMTTTPQPAALSGLPFAPAGHSLMNLRSTSVVNPDGSKTVHVFNRNFGVLEGKEVLTLYYDTNASSLLKAVETSYVTVPKVGKVRMVSCKPSQYPVIELISDECQKVFENQAMHENNIYPGNLKTTLYSNGSPTSFSTTYSQYNIYGQPGLVSETGPSGTRYKRFNYQHDTALWVLNLPTTTELSSNNSSWTTVNQTTYYAANSASKLLPHQEYQFGSLISSNTYHTSGGAIGNLLRQTYNAPNRWVEFNNYKRGIPQQITLPGRYTASAVQSAYQSVNDRGEIQSVTNFRGHTSSYAYDALGRLSLITPPAPWAPTVIDYSSQNGRFVQTITRGAYEKRIEMDALFRPLLTRERDTARNINVYVRQQFDAYNQPVFTSFPSENDDEPNGQATLYDGLQRVKRQYSTVDNTGVDYYYLTNNRVETVDSLGNRSTTTFRAFGSPEQKLPTLISQPEDVSTAINYSVFDNVSSVLQGGVTELRFYNAQQRLCRLYRPDVGATAYDYNIVGDVIWEAKGASGANNACSTASVLASEKINFTYDNIGNIRQISYPDGSGNSVYTYDNQGSLTNLTSGSTAWEYQYNSQSMVEKETLLVDGLAFVLDPSYNGLGHMTSLSYPSGRNVSFTVDALGRSLSSGSYATNAQYFPNGQLKSFNYGNALTFNQTLDNQQRPELRRVSQSANLLSQLYSYDSNSNLTSITDAVTPSNSMTNMTYDGLGRLKTANGFWGAGSFSYDALGNITRKTLGAQDIIYSYNGNNQLASISGSLSQSFGYDNRGNVTNNGVRAFNFNRANRLTSSGTNSYVYDGHGRRIIKNKNGAKTYSLYNSAGVLMSTYENNGYTDYYYLGSQLVAKYADPRTQSDEPGYTGHVEDNDLQLTYMQQRYYDPVVGRFYSNDPVGAVEHLSNAEGIMGFNRYSYAVNNPYKYTDPDGRVVVVASRNLDIDYGIGKAGSHSMVIVSTGKGDPVILSSLEVNGKNVFGKNHAADVQALANGDITDSIVIQPPEGMTSDQFDRAVLSQGEFMATLEPLDYSAIPALDGGATPNEGNCHTSTRNLINGAGGAIPKEFNPSGFNPDLHSGRSTSERPENQ